MKRLRSDRLSRFALLLWAQLALLPPGAWALCLGPQGHMAFEPIAVGCNDDFTAPDEAACDAASCEPCVDLPLLKGLVIHPAQPELDGPDCVPALLSASTAASDILSRPGIGTDAARSSHAPPPRVLTSILRC